MTEKPKTSQSHNPYRAAAESKEAPATLATTTRQHRIFAYLLAYGVKPEEAAEVMGFSGYVLSQLMSKPETTGIIEEIKAKKRGDKPVNQSQRVKQMLPDALNVMEQALSDTTLKMSDRLKTAKDILEQGMGKAVQRHEVQTNLLSDLIDGLDQMQKRGVALTGQRTEKDVTAIDVESQTESTVNEPEIDPLQRWVDENMEKE